MGKTILLADDSITIQKVIELTFSDEDFDVVTVGNGRLAMERALEVRPDIVLCDVIMPEKDGYEVCDFIKRNPQLSNVPVLLLTGAFEPFDQERATRAGCDGFLAKPFEPDTLIAKVKELLQKATTRNPSSSGARAALGAPAAPPAAPVPAPPTRSGVPFQPDGGGWGASVTGAWKAVRLGVPPPTPAIEAAPLAAPAAPPPVAAVPTVEAAPAPSPAPGQAADEALRFIPDEPFADLDTSELGGTEPMPDEVAVSHHEVEAAPSEPEVYSVAEELEAMPEDLLQMTPEESESLAPAAADSSRTVMFRPEDAPWAQAVATAAAAPIAAPEPAPEPAPMAAAPELEEAGVFEEVLEEDVEGLVGAEPVVESEAASEPLETLAPDLFVEEPAPVSHSLPEALPVSASAEEVDLEAELLPVPSPPAVKEPAVEPVVEAAAPPVPTSVESFADLTPPEPEAHDAPSVAAEIAVPHDMVAQIAQRVVAQISEKVVRQIAWEVIPDLAEGLIKREIERLKAELQQT